MEYVLYELHARGADAGCAREEAISLLGYANTTRRADPDVSLRTIAPSEHLFKKTRLASWLGESLPRLASWAQLSRGYRAGALMVDKDRIYVFDRRGRPTRDS